MPTDEQRMRERFEESAVQVLGFEAGDFDREESGEYVEYVSEAAWQMFRARAAEVRKLTDLLSELYESTSELWDSTYVGQHNSECVERVAEALDAVEVFLEGGEDDT